MFFRVSLVAEIFSSDNKRKTSQANSVPSVNDCLADSWSMPGMSHHVSIHLLFQSFPLVNGREIAKMHFHLFAIAAYIVSLHYLPFSDCVYLGWLPLLCAILCAFRLCLLKTVQQRLADVINRFVNWHINTNRTLAD